MPMELLDDESEGQSWSNLLRGVGTGRMPTAAETMDLVNESQRLVDDAPRYAMDRVRAAMPSAAQTMALVDESQRLIDGADARIPAGVMPAAGMPNGLMQDPSRSAAMDRAMSLAPPAAFDPWATSVPASQRGYRALGFSPQQAMTGNSRDSSRIRRADGVIAADREGADRNAAMHSALGQAFMQHVIAPYFSAYGQQGAAVANADGMERAAREKALGEDRTERTRAESARTLQADSTRGQLDLERLKQSNPALAKVWESIPNGRGVFNPQTGDMKLAPRDEEPSILGQRMQYDDGTVFVGTGPKQMAQVDPLKTLGAPTAGAVPVAPATARGAEIRQKQADGRVAVYDAASKKFLRFE